MLNTDYHTCVSCICIVLLQIFFFPLHFYILILTLGHHSLSLGMTRESSFHKALCDSTLVSGNLTVVLSSVGLIELLGLCMYSNFAEKKCLLFNSLIRVFLFFFTF